MAKNIQKCLRCKKELVEYRMVMTIGPRGYRRYAVCMDCAAKVDRQNKKQVVKVGA